MEAAEKTGTIHKGCVAYRKGKGCHDITHILVSIKEDAIEHDIMLIIISEDEEKI